MGKKSSRQTATDFFVIIDHVWELTKSRPPLVCITIENIDANDELIRCWWIDSFDMIIILNNTLWFLLRNRLINMKTNGSDPTINWIRSHISTDSKFKSSTIRFKMRQTENRMVFFDSFKLIVAEKQLFAIVKNSPEMTKNEVRNSPLGGISRFDEKYLFERKIGISI